MSRITVTFAAMVLFALAHARHGARASAGPTTRAIDKGRLTVAVPEGWVDDDRAGYALALYSGADHAWLWLHVGHKEDYVDDVTAAEIIGMQLPNVVDSLENPKTGPPEERDVRGRRVTFQRVEGSKDRVRWVWVYAVAETDEHFFTVVVTARPSGMEGAMAGLETVLSTVAEKRDGEPAITKPTTRP